jgi:hypothetical protein
MKTTLTFGTFRGRPCYRFKAVIRENVEHGIKGDHQKTWRAEAGDPMFDLKTIRPSFEAEARRWRIKIMQKLFPSQPEQKMVEQDIL